MSLAVGTRTPDNQASAAPSTQSGPPRAPQPTRDALQPPPLARKGLDRRGESREDLDWLRERWSSPDTRVLAVAGDRALLDPSTHGLVLVDPEAAPDGERCLLGVDAHGTAYFAVLVVGAQAEQLRADPRAGDLRMAGALLGDQDAGMLVHAAALANWHATHPRCARCGAPTRTSAAGHVRRCPQCAAVHFPRTDPAIIVLVRDGRDRALLGRQARWPARRYSTLAGFVEPGESLEQAVSREVHEETGVRLLPTETRYAGSQPWPFPSSLMLGFYALAETTEIQVDGVELAQAHWYSRAELADALISGDVLLPPPVSISRRLIEGWYGSGLPAPDGPAEPVAPSKST